MDNIETLVEVGIWLLIIWDIIRNILFSTKKDEREVLALFNAMKATILLITFIMGLVIMLNILNGITTISITHIFIIGTIGCISLVLLYKFNLNNEFGFLDKIEKIQKKPKNKFRWNKAIMETFRQIFFIIAIFINHEFFHSRIVGIIVIVAYILAFICDYLLCKTYSNSI